MGCRSISPVSSADYQLSPAPLNDGDVVRAQLTALHLQLPEPPSLAKNALSQSDVAKLTVLLDCAGVLKINARHYPAGAPDGKGGQFAPNEADIQATSESHQHVRRVKLFEISLLGVRRFGSRHLRFA